MADVSRRLIGLKLTLEALDVPVEPTTFPNRLLLQKATYLAQAFGVRLGYRYNWYLKGPYSPELTRDYFELAATTEIPNAYRLNGETVERLKTLGAKTNPPVGVDLAREEWLELLASLHYLQTTLGIDRVGAAARIRSVKPHLSKYLKAGHLALASLQLA